MGDPLRREVLQAFKNLHRARKVVFNGDLKALTEKILSKREWFFQLVLYANEVAKELRTTVVQAKETKAGTFELNITSDTERLDHFPFDPNVEIPRGAWKKRKNQPCCQENLK
ncbi:uncharacterized protein isoform X2 [Rhodnius prolixus]|uniref:uncharacterized protein isoform X2 n=1 Tax=Rhodnius prolixus TaxID=13249 RepID=UPI003D18C64E